MAKSSLAAIKAFLSRFFSRRSALVLIGTNCFLDVSVSFRIRIIYCWMRKYLCLHLCLIKLEKEIVVNIRPRILENHILWPVNEMLIDLLDCLGNILRQLDFLPHFIRECSPFNNFYI